MYIVQQIKDSTKTQNNNHTNKKIKNRAQTRMQDETHIQIHNCTQTYSNTPI